MTAQRRQPVIAVTGAGGGLGRRVVYALLRQGRAVRGLGRAAVPNNFPAPWSRVDVRSGDGLASALAGADIVIHAASDPFVKGADVQAAHNLARCARAAGVPHLVYVQIAGIADAAKVFPYYRDKLLAEQVLKQADIVCSVAAATQFHSLVDRILTALSAGPILALSNFTMRPVDTGFFADRLAEHAATLDPQGITVQGPETLTSRDLAVAWLAAKRRRARVLPIPKFGPLKAFARLQQTDALSGGCTWREWLDRHN